jgi:hypothetical protein
LAFPPSLWLPSCLLTLPSFFSLAHRGHVHRVSWPCRLIDLPLWASKAHRAQPWWLCHTLCWTPNNTAQPPTSPILHLEPRLPLQLHVCPITEVVTKSLFWTMALKF